MSLLFAFVALAFVLLAVDLLTAPKCGEAAAHAKLKDSRRAA
ncbi:MAG: hypothetical protein AB7O59_06900 [Pirellulales bacterium]